MINKTFVFLLLGILLVNNASALDCWQTFEQDTKIELIQKCPSCSYVNITSISYPNGTIFFNELMTKTDTNFNYTLPDSSQRGRVLYSTIGDKNGANPPLLEDLCIEITKTGSIIRKPESNFYFAIMFAILLLFAMFLTIFILTPFENKKELTREGMAITKITSGKYVKLISLWIAYGFFLWFITIINGISNNYIFFEGLRSMITNLHTFLSLIAYGLNTFMVFFLILLTWKDILWNKDIRDQGRALLKEL